VYFNFSEPGVKQFLRLILESGLGLGVGPMIEPVIRAMTMGRARGG
jgi:hypothetical protein